MGACGRTKVSTNCEASSDLAMTSLGSHLTASAPSWRFLKPFEHAQQPNRRQIRRAAHTATWPHEWALLHPPTQRRAHSPPAAAGGHRTLLPHGGNDEPHVGIPQTNSIALFNRLAAPSFPTAATLGKRAHALDFGRWGAHRCPLTAPAGRTKGIPTQCRQRHRVAG